MFDVYNLEFWQQIPFRSSSSLALLQPTLLVDDFRTGRIIPLVFSGVGPSTACNLVVAELDVEALKSMFAPYLFAVDSTLAFTDGSGTPYLVHSSVATDVSALDLGQIVEDVGFSSGVRQIRRGSNLVIAQPIQIFRNPYVLLALVPNSAVRARTAALGATVLILLSVGVVVSLLLAYLFSQRLYAPLQRLMRRVQTKRGSSALHPGDEYAYLMTEMDRLFAQEQELRSFLRERGADFRYGNFVVLLIRYEYSADYYRSFSEQSELELHATISALLSTALSGHAVVHQVRLESNLQCIVCNVDDPIESESQVQVYTGHTRSSYVLDRDAERRIENYLQIGSSDDALMELEKVVQANATERTGERAMRALFFHLYSLALQTLARAGDSFDDDDDLSIRLDDIPIFELHNRIREHFSRVASRVGDRRSVADIRQVVEYIQNL